MVALVTLLSATATESLSKPSIFYISSESVDSNDWFDEDCENNSEKEFPSISKANRFFTYLAMRLIRDGMVIYVGHGLLKLTINLIQIDPTDPFKKSPVGSRQDRSDF
jgi:hypothetical protein